MNTDFCFSPGKLTTVLDASAGSSGKGKIGSFVAEHSDNFQFCCNTFMPQAGHWVKLDDGSTYFYWYCGSGRGYFCRLASSF